VRRNLKEVSAASVWLGKADYNAATTVGGELGFDSNFSKSRHDTGLFIGPFVFNRRRCGEELNLISK
jgi:hypothetical protein